MLSHITEQKRVIGIIIELLSRGVFYKEEINEYIELPGGVWIFLNESVETRIRGSRASAEEYTTIPYSGVGSRSGHWKFEDGEVDTNQSACAFNGKMFKFALDCHQGVKIIDEWKDKTNQQLDALDRKHTPKGMQDKILKLAKQLRGIDSHIESIKTQLTCLKSNRVSILEEINELKSVVDKKIGLE
jgi:hypothetical protein